MTPAHSLHVYTVGHSTRSLEELVQLLRENGVGCLVDVRTVPRSRRNPQFNHDALEQALPAAGMEYHHLASLGGLRRGLGERSPNTGWRNDSFRGFADYMMTAQFQEGLEGLLGLAAQGPVAIMCAEAVPWRCHRSLIADALTVRGVQVSHIVGPGRTQPHRLTPFAQVKGREITYPAPGPSLPKDSGPYAGPAG